MMLAATHGSENVAYYKITNQNTVPKLGAKNAEQTCYLVQYVFTCFGWIVLLELPVLIPYGTRTHKQLIIGPKLFTSYRVTFYLDEGLPGLPRKPGHESLGAYR